MTTEKIRNEAGSSSSGSSRGESVVVDVGGRRGLCGYCKSGGRTSISYGLWAHSLTVDDYQDLLDRGWRRSGCFLYRPDMEKTCCPSYTIRLKASDFVPSNEQLRVSRRMQRFLDGTMDLRKLEEVPNEANTSKGSCGVDEVTNDEKQMMKHLADQIDNAVFTFAKAKEIRADIQFPKASLKKVPNSKRKLLVEGSEDLLYTSNISFQIAANLKRVQSEETGQSLDSSPKIIAEGLSNILLNQLAGTCDLLIRAVNGHLNLYSAIKKQETSDEGISILKVKENTSKRKKNKSAETSQRKRRKLEIRLKKSSFEQEEFDLYRRYQISVHNDSPDRVTESSYRSFLVDTPLVFVPPAGDGTVPPSGFGSFHQQYLIDGQLVAVGVIDILPKCLSSKYLFWDPDFAFLSLGKFSALQEINWVKENQAHCLSLQYYYLGYYIHSCRKMRYKAAYRPSELLCPLRYLWVSFDIAKPLLDRKPYVVLSESSILQDEEYRQPPASPPRGPENTMEVRSHDGNVQEDLNDKPIDEDAEMFETESDRSDDEAGEDVVEDGDVNKILIGLRGARLSFKDLQRAYGISEVNYIKSQLNRYTRAVGAELSERMIYSIV